MKPTKQFKRLINLNQKILERNTGTPKQFANSLGISQGHLAYIINRLRTQGVPISYCRKKQTYYYPPGIRMKVEFSLILENAGREKDLNMF